MYIHIYIYIYRERERERASRERVRRGGLTAKSHCPITMSSSTASSNPSCSSLREARERQQVTSRSKPFSSSLNARLWGYEPAAPDAVGPLASEFGTL